MTGSWVTVDLQDGDGTEFTREARPEGQDGSLWTSSVDTYVIKTRVRYFGGVHRGQCDGVVTRS